MKRLFDITVAAILLLIFAPVMMIVALCIRLDSPGPIFYASPRVGKNGRRFGQLRFRTVRMDKPGYLSMKERLSRVGRFIRNYSLDDLPNLFNILRGDLSIIGPRPTEPERVDLADPIWQKILTMRPGAFSPAIIKLARQYNASPHSLKLQLEFEYVQKQSFGYDLSLFWQVIMGFFRSKGNWKARGTPTSAIEYAHYQASSTSTSPTVEAKLDNAEDYTWRIDGWEQPDLSYVAAFVQERGHAWTVDEPQFCLVPCANSVQKPAIFLRVNADDARWAETIEFRDMQWLVASTNRYVCLGCVLCFEKQPPLNHQYFEYSTLLDVASLSVENWLYVWRHNSDTILFLIKPDQVEIQHYFLIGNGAGGIDVKTHAIQQWEEVKARLLQSGYALENFVEESKLLPGSLRNITN